MHIEKRNLERKINLQGDNLYCACRQEIRRIPHLALGKKNTTFGVKL